MTCGIFCAIDTPRTSSAVEMTARLASLPLHVKLGLEFFVAEGPAGVSAVRSAMREGSLLFLDLKLHDIPNTVAGAVHSALSCRPDFLTVHASGGRAMIKAAAETARSHERPAKILAVTVLTALDESDLAETGQRGPVQEQVLRLAALAAGAGADGIVCSPRELPLLRKELGPDILLVVPGIRPAGSAALDQKRTMTPVEAVNSGANYLVIGRPVTGAADPAGAAGNILKSLEK